MFSIILLDSSDFSDLFEISVLFDLFKFDVSMNIRHFVCRLLFGFNDFFRDSIVGG